MGPSRLTLTGKLGEVRLELLELREQLGVARAVLQDHRLRRAQEKVLAGDLPRDPVDLLLHTRALLLEALAFGRKVDRSLEIEAELDAAAADPLEQDAARRKFVDQLRRVQARAREVADLVEVLRDRASSLDIAHLQECLERLARLDVQLGPGGADRSDELHQGLHS